MKANIWPVIPAMENACLAQVNTQLGEFTLRRHTMETLSTEIEDHPDFQAVFGVAEDSSRWV